MSICKGILLAPCQATGNSLRTLIKTSLPIWITVDGKPVRVAKSIEWDIAALAQAFEVKRRGWGPNDYPEAKAAYDYAYESYAKRLREARSN